MKKYGSYSLIKSLLFERIGGSKEELKAAKIIQEELKKDGIESHLEEFEVDSFEIMEAKLEVLEPCLLYTSPSPRDRTRSRMPSSAWKKKKPT